MLKPKFCIDDYDSSHVMYCDNEDEAKIFYEYLHSQGKKWCNGREYVGKNSIGYDPSNPCYKFAYGYRCSVEYYTNEGHTILYFSDFDWGEPEVKKVVISYDSLFE